MNIVLRFGSTEKEFAQKEERFVRDFVQDYQKENKEVYFNDEKFLSALKEAIGERDKKYKEDDKKYKETTDYPERYSYYYFTVLSDMFNVVVIFDISHINRHHPFSKDGWALMGIEHVVRIKRDYD